MNSFLKNLKTILICLIISVIAHFLYICVGGYKFEDVPSLMFSTFFIPAIVLIINFVLNKELNRDEYLESQYKRNEFFKREKLIDDKKYNIERERIKKEINNLPIYKNK